MKIAIYTAIFGNKDIIKQPINYKQEEGVDYFLITDNKKSYSFNYQIIYKKPIYDDITKNARYYKIMGLDILKEYDFVIWHDANIQVMHNEILNIIKFAQNSGFAFFKHPERNCIYDEAIKCIELEKDYPFKILRQVYSYYIAGIENKIGLYATGLFIKNNKFTYEDFLNLWWDEIKFKSRRDQLSLPYFLNKFKIIPGIIEGCVRENKYSIFHSHNHSNYYFLSTGKSKPFYAWSKKISVSLIKFIKIMNK